jgi:hypothetical protein
MPARIGMYMGKSTCEKTGGWMLEGTLCGRQMGDSGDLGYLAFGYC